MRESTSKFTFIELFAGIGGFRSALEPLGGECVFASEIDKYAVKSYSAIHGGNELQGDITKINAADIPDHDLLVAGFPCQSFSVAGHQRGFEDARGTLFFEVARIAAQKKPKTMLLENVKGLISHDNGKTLRVMLQMLDSIGYAIDFTVLNSKHFGVPQNRERIFILCSRDAAHQAWDIVGNGMLAKAKRTISALGIRTFNFKWPENDTVTTRLRDVLEDQVAENFYLSHEKTAKLLAQLEERQHSYILDMRQRNELRVYETVAPTCNGTDYKEPKLVVEPFCIDDQGRSKPLKPLDIVPTLRREMHGNEPRVVEPQVFRPVRTEYGRNVRKQYESGEIHDSRHNMTEMLPREDGISNTITTVLKDNILIEPTISIDLKGDSSATRRGIFKSDYVGALDHNCNTGVIEVIGQVDIKGNDILKRVYAIDGIAPTLNSMGGGSREPKIAIECVGNVNPSQRGMNGFVFSEDGLSPTLTINKGEGPKILAEMMPVEYSQEKSGQFALGNALNVAHSLNASDWRGLNRKQTQNAVLEVKQYPFICNHGKLIVREDGLSTCLDRCYNFFPDNHGQRTGVIEEVLPVLTPERPEKRQNGRRFKEDDEEAFTLTAQDRHGVALGSYPYYRIRKLTPLECFRLQGFTDRQWWDAKNCGMSDSQLYKQAGNAVTVNVITAIGERMVPFMSGNATQDDDENQIDVFEVLNLKQDGKGQPYEYKGGNFFDGEKKPSKDNLD